tara:strand:- start:871 stop:1128 length:258 start_codon:yes stop_codon:yes gene_type:complete
MTAIPQSSIVHCCPFCGRLILGPAFFRHAPICHKNKQIDIRQYIPEDTGSNGQKWSFTRGWSGQAMIAPQEPNRGNFHNKYLGYI